MMERKTMYMVVLIYRFGGNSILAHPRVAVPAFRTWRGAAEGRFIRWPSAFACRNCNAFRLLLCGLCVCKAACRKPLGSCRDRIRRTHGCAAVEMEVSTAFHRRRNDTVHEACSLTCNWRYQRVRQLLFQLGKTSK